MTETFSPIGINPATVSFGGDGWDINEYNGFNQLIKSSSDGVEVEYVYKPNGLRLSKTENGTKTTHIWDGDNIAAELSGSSVAATYLRGLNLIYSQKSGSKAYYSFNAHGDVVQLTNTSGNISKDYRYDAFGNEYGQDANDINPWRYSGAYPGGTKIGFASY
jgi:YD repeat-containing protein